MKNALIIGCGYLGMRIAKLLSEKKWHVTATTRKPERLQELAKVSQKGVILKGGTEEELAQLIHANDLIIMTLGADKREQYESVYLHTAQMIRQIASHMKTPKTLIYTSSTSVYGDHHGMWVDESTALLGASPQAKCLIETENSYLSLQELHWHVTIFRVAEMYGPGREPSQRLKHIQGNKLPGSSDHYTNMIHVDDCASGVMYTISHHLDGVFNLADDVHPTKQEFFDLVSKKHHLPKLEWDSTLFSFHSGNKRVSNHKIKATGFTFMHPERLID